MFTLLQFLFFCSLSFSTFHVKGTGGEKVVVKEGEDVVLPCSLSTKENIELKLFDWKKAAPKDERQKEVFFYDAGVHYNNGRDGQSEQFKGQVSHFPEELKHGNASITIRNTKVTDSGNYTCDFPRLQPRQTFQIQLVVGAILKDRRGEITDATPEPYITILNATDLWALLQCVVRGASPKPAVEWRDSSGNKLPAKEAQVSERGGSYDIILQTTVTKTGFYKCVVTQETLSHQTEAQTFVPLCGKVCEDSSNAVVGGFFGGFVLASVLAAVLVLLVDPKFYTRRRKPAPRHDQNGSCGADAEMKNLTNGDLCNGDRPLRDPPVC